MWQVHSAQLDTGILQALCTCQMGRYVPPAGPDSQPRQQRYELFMVPVPQRSSCLPVGAGCLGEMSQYLCSLVLRLDDVIGFFTRRFKAFLSVDGFQHQRDLPHFCARHMAEHIAVPMHGAALPAGLWIKIADALLRS